jgi:HEAT repeat protein
MHLEELKQSILNPQTPSYQKIAHIFEVMNRSENEALDILFECIKTEPCELVAHEAVFALGEMISERTIPFLKKTLQTHPSIVVQHECLMSLGTIGTKEDISFIEPYTTHHLFEIACSAKCAIQRIKQNEDFENEVKKNVEKYCKELFDYEKSNQNRRIQILFQLMRIESPQAIEAISKCLETDPCRIVRHEAGFVLGEIGTSETIQNMAKALEKEETPIVIHETLFALGTTGKQEALPIIERYINHNNYVISESAKIAKDRVVYLKNPYSGARHFKEQ